MNLKVCNNCRHCYSEWVTVQIPGTTDIDTVIHKSCRIKADEQLNQINFCAYFKEYENVIIQKIEDKAW